MSFYWDEEEAIGEKEARGNNGDENHICTNCGSSSFYRDSETDNLICNDCFTQSQTQSQRAMVDDEDIEILAARGKHGNLKAKDNRKKKKTLEDYDNSRPLPDLVTCCNGIQVILIKAARRAAFLAGIEQKEDVDRMVDIVKEMWFAYIKAWKYGADAYGAVYPELRFSFRDAFLSGMQMSMLMRHLSARCTSFIQEIEEGGNLGNSHSAVSAKKTKKKKKKIQWKEDNVHIIPRDNGFCSDSGSDSSNSPSDTKLEDEHHIGESINIDRSPPYESVNNIESTDKETEWPRKRQLYRRHYERIETMLDDLFLRPHEQLDKRHAALRIKPSINLIYSLIYVALLRLRTGVATSHLIFWSSNGSLPYALNSFVHLPIELQERLKLIKNFFIRNHLPTTKVLEHYADLLVIVCGLDEMNRHPFDEFAIEQSNNFSILNGNGIRELVTLDNEEEVQQLNMRKMPFMSRENLKRFVSSYGGNKTTMTTSTDGISISFDNNSINENMKNGKPQHYYQDNIPLMAARFIVDLGLDQKVLDITLALMGLYTPDQEEEERIKQGEYWLPAPLNGAAPHRLLSPLHVMAVIAVACKMCRGWEGWMVELSLDAMTHNPSQDSNVNENLYCRQGNDDERLHWGDNTKMNKYNKNPRRQRLIPWNEEQFNLIGNGLMLHDYFDYLEEQHGSNLPVMKEFEDVVSSFTDVFNNNERRKSSRGDSENILKTDDDENEISSTSTLLPSVKPNLILAGGRNPNMPSKVKEKGRNFHCNLLCRKKSAVWADANGLGEYIIYKDIKSHATTKKKISTNYELLRMDPKPFHPHYGLLIEHMAYKVFAEPGELHYLVACLDEEVSKYGQPSMDWKQKYVPRFEGLNFKKYTPEKIKVGRYSRVLDSNEEHWKAKKKRKRLEKMMREKKRKKKMKEKKSKKRNIEHVHITRHQNEAMNNCSQLEKEILSSVETIVAV